MRKTILITGASSGLGAGLARIYAAQGRSLALCARRLERLEALKAEFPQAKISIKQLDVTNHEDVFRVFKEFQAEFGTIDRFIINAGVGRGQPLGTGGFDINKALVETNVLGALACMESAVEILRAQNFGHLVTISSMSAVRGLAGKMNVYGATKAGLYHLTEGLKLEFLNTPLKISCILPGYIKTEMNSMIRDSVPMRVDETIGVAALYKAIEREPVTAAVPAWPWVGLRILLKILPLSLIKKLT